MVVAAVACVSHAGRVPPALLAAAAVVTIDYLLRLAPTADSCMAGELLDLALLSGEWDAWRPHVGSITPVLQRCASFLELLQRFVTALGGWLFLLDDHPTTNSTTPKLLPNLPTQLDILNSLCHIADAVQGRLSSLQAGAVPSSPAPARLSLDLDPADSSDSVSWASGGPALRLAQGPAGEGARRAHVLGGLYIAASLMGAGGGASDRQTPPTQRQLRLSASSPSPSSAESSDAAAAAAAAAGRLATARSQPVAGVPPPSLRNPVSYNPLRRTSTGLQYEFPGEAPASPAWQLQPNFLPGQASAARANGSAVAAIAASAASASSPLSAQQSPRQAALEARGSPTAAAGAAAAAAAAGAPLPTLLFTAGRGQLAAWLRCCGDVMAGLALVEPDGFLNEISHGLAGATFHIPHALIWAPSPPDHDLSLPPPGTAHP